MTQATTELIVRGMTCEHCVRAIHEEVSGVAGVASVAVDLVTGRLVVTGEGVEEGAVRAAVDEAGYEVAP